jgi:hypothetical protein
MKGRGVRVVSLPALDFSGVGGAWMDVTRAEKNRFVSAHAGRSTLCQIAEKGTEVLESEENLSRPIISDDNVDKNGFC